MCRSLAVTPPRRKSDPITATGDIDTFRHCSHRVFDGAAPLRVALICVVLSAAGLPAPLARRQGEAGANAASAGRPGRAAGGYRSRPVAPHLPRQNDVFMTGENPRASPPRDDAGEVAFHRRCKRGSHGWRFRHQVCRFQRAITQQAFLVSRKSVRAGRNNLAGA